jgi:uncharacterized protein
VSLTRSARSSDGTRALGEAVLEDHAFLAQALLDLHRVAPDDAWLNWARDLLTVIDGRFADADGALYATPSAHTPLGRRLDVFDGVVPSGGAATVGTWLTLAELTAEDRWRERARRQVLRQAGLIGRAALEMAGWLSAMLRLDPAESDDSCRPDAGCRVPEPPMQDDGGASDETKF